MKILSLCMNPVRHPRVFKESSSNLILLKVVQCLEASDLSNSSRCQVRIRVQDCKLYTKVVLQGEEIILSQLRGSRTLLH